MFKLTGTGSRRLQQFMARRWRPLVAGLLAASAGFAALELTPDVPNIFNPNESQFQSETHFLVFREGDEAGENATTAKAYYKAIDPNNAKPTFEDWLVKAGFIKAVPQPPDGQRFLLDPTSMQVLVLPR